MTEFANETDLQTEVNDKPKIDKDNRVIGQILRIIKEWKPNLNIKEYENDLIDERLAQTHSVNERNRNDRFPSYILQIVRFKTRRRMKLVDFKLESDGASEEEKQLVTDFVVQKMKEGNWQEFMTGKRGIYDKITTYGDAFGRAASFKNKVGLSEKERESVITYQNTQLSKLYWDIFCTDIRNPGGEGDANEVVAVYTYSWDQAIELYPEIEKLATIGQLPDSQDSEYAPNDLTPEQRSFVEQRKIELGFYYNKRDRIYSMVAGAVATQIFEFKGDKYPFVFALPSRKGEAYIPFLHFFAFIKPEGLYGTGMCGLFYNIDMVWQELMNRGAGYIMENLDPLKIINLPAGQQQNFFKKVEQAVAMQEHGGRPVIVNELDATANPNVGQLQTMSAPVLTGEFERLINELRLISGMIGVKLDELISTPGKPLGTTELELESQSESVLAILDANRSELEFAVELAMDAIARDVKSTDDTPIRTQKKKMAKKDGEGNLVTGETGIPEEVDIPEIARTAGAAADSLRKRRYTVKINTASGAVKNNILELTQIQRLKADPNLDPRFRKFLMNREAQLQGFNPPEESAPMPFPQGAQGTPQPEEVLPTGV
jgi:hypothetical protein